MFAADVVQVEDINTAAAVKTVIRRLRWKLDGRQPQAGIVLAGIDSDHSLILGTLKDAFPTMDIVGCTTAGELSSDFGFSDASISIMVIGSDTLTIGVGIGHDLSRDPMAATTRAVHMAKDRLGKGERLCLVFPNGLHDSPETILDTLNRQVAPDCMIFGGLSARHWQGRTPTRQFYGNRVYEDALPLMLIGGPVRHQFVLSNSWEPVGNRESVSRAAGHELLEIGGRSALAFFRNSLGPHSSPALEFPLAVYEDEDSGFYIRSPMDYHESTGGVVFSTPIPQGASVQLTEATRGGLLEDMGLKLEGLAAHSGPWVNTAACLVFSCATRKQILGTQTSKEIDLLRRKLPESLPILGFYSYGEISPIPGLRRSSLHNCTMVALLFGEEDQGGVNVSAIPAGIPEPYEDGMSIDLADHVAFLQKKLERSEAYRERLELNKDLTTTLLRKINYEINGARLEIKRKNDMLARTLALADEIQQNLLPDRELETRFFDIAGTSVFCSETGGDYYDVVSTDAGHCLHVAVGDVTGHGIEAALLMTTVRALLRARLSQPGDLAQVMTDVNRQLAQDVKDSGRFVTLFLLSLDPEAGVMEWVRAGHDPAVWYDPAHDRFRALRGPGVALGIDDSVRFTVGRRTGLREGHILCLGTDGIWEARNEMGDAFGKARLLKMVKAFQHLPASGMLDAILVELTRFRGNRELEDDITLVVIKAKSLPGAPDPIFR